jgi:hypothetical protein
MFPNIYTVESAKTSRNRPSRMMGPEMAVKIALRPSAGSSRIRDMESELSSALLVELPPQPVARPSTYEGAVSTADLAECTCPDFCERDHDND